MHIRCFEKNDFDEWLRMRQTLWPDSTREEAELLRGGAIGLRIFVAVRDDGRLAGFVEVGTRDIAEGCESSPVGYIEGWYVDEDVRRLGIGSDLIRAAEAWATKRGCREIASDCDIDNAVSLAAHTTLGFMVTGQIVCFRKRLVSEAADS